MDKHTDVGAAVAPADSQSSGTDSQGRGSPANAAAHSTSGIGSAAIAAALLYWDGAAPAARHGTRAPDNASR